MKKTSKKFLFIFLLCFLVAGIFLPALKAFAKLEVVYPPVIDIKGTKIGIGGSPELEEYLYYILNLGMFIGFVAVFGSLVWAGALYLLSPAVPNALNDAKDRVSGAISGLLILVTFYLIMTTINPSLAVFKLSKVEPVQQPPLDPEAPAGVYFYNASKCEKSMANSGPNTSSLSDLGDLKNRVNSASLVHHPNKGLYYIGFLYDLINFSGMCMPLDYTASCQNVSPFADSSSVHQYEPKPNGDGVYLFRKSFFNWTGGWRKISNVDILNSKIYIEKLENLEFKDSSSASPDGCTVQEDEQDCAFYDKNGNCAKKKCPNASGENLSSIRIRGNYSVLLVYFDETKDQKLGPWTFCQEFPAKDDIAKNGPNQIKWENIKTISGAPNYIIIIPIK